jgi:radical SAM protein with 4Fe4S-binding SPASM domain
MNEISLKENEKKNTELNKDEILNVVDQLPWGSNVTFTGGEIFLKDGIEEIITKSSINHNVSIATNGILLNKHAEMLVKAGVQSIGVSLDGPKEIHNQVRNLKNAFEKLMTGVQTLLKIKEKSKSVFPKINVNTVIIRENYQSIFEIIRILKDIGLNSCTFQILDFSLIRSGIAPNKSIDFNNNPLRKSEYIDSIELKQSLQKIISVGKRFGIETRFSPSLTIDEIINYYQGKFNCDQWKCYHPWQTMRISPYGDVYPCMNLLIGNIRKHRLDELWNSEPYVAFRKALKKASLFPSCIGCCKKLRKKILSS